MGDFDVVVIGACVIDLVSYVDDHPKPGETVQCGSFSEGFGGKGANACVMAARLGARCAIITKLGNDSYGHDTIKNFKDYEINTDFALTTDEAASGLSSVAVNNKGENAIVFASRANLFLRPEEVHAARDMLAGAKVVVCQLEIKPETTLAGLKMARQMGAITIFNAAPGIRNLDREFFENSDILCVNETEAGIMTGLPVKDVETAKKAMVPLQRSGMKCVILTLGEKGLLYTQLLKNHKSNHWTAPQHIQVEQVDVIDTTGAGDAFVGALACFLADNPSSVLTAKEQAPLLGKLLRKSAQVATHTVTAKGTQTSYYTVDTLKDLPKKLSK